MSRTVRLLTGSLPPAQNDGVGDYTRHLHDALTKQQAVEMLHAPITSLREWWRYARSRLQGQGILNVQYPCEGWGQSIAPGLLPFLLRLTGSQVRIVTTLHEWRRLHPLRRLSILPLVIGSEHLIFVSRQERSAFERTLLKRLFGKDSSVIPIGINITIPQLDEAMVQEARARYLRRPDRERLLVHFGFIYQAKQPFKLLDALRRLREDGIAATLVFIGDFPEDKHEERRAFLDHLDALQLHQQVKLLGFVDDETVITTTIAAADAFVALYDDGLSSRRGSFWLASQLGCSIITTELQNPDEFTDFGTELAPPHITFISPKAPAADLARTVATLPPFQPLRWPPLPAPRWSEIASAYLELFGKLNTNQP